MSVDLFPRVTAAAVARLDVAPDDAARRCVVVEHMGDFGSHIAERLFLRILELAPLTAEEIGGMTLRAAVMLAASVVEMCDGLAVEPDGVEALGTAAQTGFVDRIEALLSAPSAEGRA